MSDLGRRTAPFRDYGFTPPQPSLARESAFTRDQQTQLERSSQVDLDRDDLSLLAGTLERLDREIEVDQKEFGRSKSSVPSDLDLLSGAMEKISSLENELTLAKRRAQKAELEVQFINRPAYATAHEPFFLEENRRLRKQVSEMEQFLADYGLIWVGSQSDEEDSDSESLSDGEETSQKYDLEKIVKNVKELNILGGEGRSLVETKNGASQIVPKAPSLKLTLYENGILLGDGPFRCTSQAEHFLNDIRDGYFPSELQSRYPDGLIFDLIDRHQETYNHKFPGTGKRLKDQPVISVDDPRVVETDVSREMSAGLEQNFSDTRSSLSRVPTAKAITLRVRNFDGSLHVLRLRSNDTIDSVRSYLSTELGHSNFKILTLSEKGWQSINDENQSLAEIGLGPRATLQLAQNEESRCEEMQKHIDNLKTPRKIY